MLIFLIFQSYKHIIYTFRIALPSGATITQAIIEIIAIHINNNFFLIHNIKFK